MGRACDFSMGRYGVWAGQRPYLQGARSSSFGSKYKLVHSPYKIAQKGLVIAISWHFNFIYSDISIRQIKETATHGYQMGYALYFVDSST
jgi:hypothetical protein